MAKASYDVPAVRKAIRLLEVLCDAPRPMGVSELAQQLKLNKNMVFRLLRTLCEEGWVIQEEGPTYRISLLPFHHISKPVGRMDVVAAAEPSIDALWQATGECVNFGILDGHRILCLVQRTGRREVEVSGRVGGRFFLHCGAPGKAILAHAPEELFDELTEEGFPGQTEKTITEPVALSLHLREARRLGYTVDDEEYLKGMLCLAAPVFDFSGKVIGAVGVTTLTLYHTLDSLIESHAAKVMEAGRRISRALGCPDARASVGFPLGLGRLVATAWQSSNLEERVR